MNYENFNRVLTHIEQHPEEWDQAVWHCRTSHCFAGFSEIFGGHVPPLSEDLHEDICKRACAFLGIEANEEESGAYMPHWNWLFHGDRTLDDFRRVRLVACRANYEKVMS